MDLRALQSRFSSLVQNGCKHPEREQWIKHTPPMSAERRLAIYQYAYHARIEESLIEDFPLTRKQLGKPRFLRAISHYLSHQPSPFSSLAEVSGPFPGYLAQRKELAVCPQIAELARFEWLKILSRLEDCIPISNLFELTSLDPTHLPKVIFELHPSVYLFESHYRVTQLNQPGWKSTTRLLIRRHQGTIRYRILSHKKWRLLQLISTGTTVKKLTREVSPTALQSLSRWAKEGIIHRYRFDSLTHKSNGENKREN